MNTEAATGGVLLRKGVLRNFAKLTGKQLCQSLFFNKVAGLRPATLLKKRLWQFSCEFYEISKNTLFAEHFQETASFLFIFFLESEESV